MNRRMRNALGLTLAAIAMLAACDSATDRVVIGAGDDAPDAAAAPPESPGIDSKPDAAPDLRPEQPSRGICVATECPTHYDSCPDFSDRLPPFPCQTDLRNDIENCGACGAACPLVGVVNMVSSCIDGTCEASCREDTFDCNGIIDDGCEMSLAANDPNNCGACGVVCGEGTPCVDGVCGCPAGKTLCGGQCVDLSDDNANCGACNTSCLDHQPEDAGMLPPHMTYVCAEGACARLDCEPGFEAWRNCNGSLDDGCEVALAQRDELGFADPDNCGQCGKTCAPGRKCFDTTGDGPACECSTGQTICPGPSCADLENDPNNCGACNSFCPSPVLDGTGNGKPSCERGQCGFECGAGFASCNDTMEDGCEADLLRDPRNCGGCGVQCDLGAGQPCFNGECLKKPCDEAPR